MIQQGCFVYLDISG